MTLSGRQALMRLRRNRPEGEAARPSFVPPPEEQVPAEPGDGLRLRPMALGQVAEAAIARSRDAGGTTRDQCEAAFRALLESEPCLPVASAQRLIDEALRRQGRRPSALATLPVAVTIWVVFATLLAVLASAAAFPLALAVALHWWAPVGPSTLGPLSMILVFTLPIALVGFIVMAWRAFLARRPAGASALACLPLVYIAGTAASMALP